MFDDPDFIEKSAAETNKVNAEEYDNYNEFVAAKFATIPPSIVALMSGDPRDMKILFGVQALWINEFWDSRKSARSLKN